LAFAFLPVIFSRIVVVIMMPSPPAWRSFA
jgi:hypothetical protein